MVKLLMTDCAPASYARVDLVFGASIESELS